MITDQSRCNGVTSINKIGIKMAYGLFKPKAIWLTWPNIPGHKDKEGENNLIKESRKIIPPPLEMLDERRGRSEEHTSELQSRPHLVCRLLLEKKKKKKKTKRHNTRQKYFNS